MGMETDFLKEIGRTWEGLVYATVNSVFVAGPWDRSFVVGGPICPAVFSKPAQAVAAGAGIYHKGPS